MFEPFRYSTVNGVAIANAIAEDPALYTKAKTALTDIFNCHLTKDGLDWAKLQKR